MKTTVDRAYDAQHVKRWNLVATTAESTVASHSFNVAMLAMAIRKFMFNTGAYSEQEVCYYAILHDIDEVFTGDLPTPTKEAIRKQGVEPNSLFPGQEVVVPPGPIKDIIKIADLMDNYLFISQHGQGTRAGTAVVEVEGRLREAIAGAPPDLRAAASRVLDYVENRKSEQPEERERLKEDAERLRSTREHFHSGYNVG